VVGDLIQSVGVFIVAVVIWFKPEWVWFDPLCTVAFSVIVFFTTVPISKECIRILMECSPENKDIEEIKKEISAVPGVLSIIELRMWNINDSRAVLSAKLLLEKHSSTVVVNVKKVCKKHKIFHNTIETQVRTS
jgi:zinc transporter 2